ncbi:MAG: glycosyltransferase family 9 protein [Thermodesulfobacteriota bacterium]|nr:glycosyltransferase family 9 protein [Thermodesulfobacteriota bacterium]
MSGLIKGGPGPPLYIIPEKGLAHSPWIRETTAQAAGKGELGAMAHSDDLSALALSPGPSIFAYGGGNLTAARRDLAAQKKFYHSLKPANIILLKDLNNPRRYDAYRTWLRLLGVHEFTELSQNGPETIRHAPAPKPGEIKSLRLTACGGIGNLILTTPLVSAALKVYRQVRFRPIFDADSQSPAVLFQGLDRDNLIFEPPHEDRKADVDLSLNIDAPARLEKGDFYFSNHLTGIQSPETDNYALFFENVTGVAVETAETFVGGADVPERLKGRIVVCPGSKVGWDSKRWPHMNRLLEKLDHPVVLCRGSDLRAYAQLEFLKPITAKNAEFITDFDLARAAGLLKNAKAVVANECGLAHMAAAAKTRTLILFGPSSDIKNTHPGGNVKNLMLDLECRPCQGGEGGPGALKPNRYHCDLGYACLRDLSVDRVLQELWSMLNDAGS